MTKSIPNYIPWFLFFIFPILFHSCIGDPVVEDQPGIVRVVLTADPADTQITILGQTVVVSDDPANMDSLGVNIFQGQAISTETVADTAKKFAILFESVEQHVQVQNIYNLLTRKDNQYLEHVVFESFVPAGNYSGISMGIEGLHMSIGVFEIPVELPPGAKLNISLSADYQVMQKQVTEIRVQLSPFQSMRRRLDAFVFDRVVEIARVQVLGKEEFDRVVSVLPPILNPNNPFSP